MIPYLWQFIAMCLIDTVTNTFNSVLFNMQLRYFKWKMSR